jgi:hypothetical protein
MIASRSTRTTPRASRFHPIAATRSAASTANTTKVKKVVATGRVFDVADLVKRGQ